MSIPASGFYTTGTASVANAGTAVTGQGTQWAGTIRAGDILMVQGFAVRIASVEGSGALTLAEPWPGTALTEDPYAIQFTPYASRVNGAVVQLIELLGQGGLPALGELEGIAADTLPYFNSESTMALAAITEFARTLLGAADDGAAATVLGLGSGAFADAAAITAAINARLVAANNLSDLPDKAASRASLELGTAALAALTTSSTDTTAGRAVRIQDADTRFYRRGNILGTVSQAAGVPTGAIVERGSNANGDYVRFADGTQQCWQDGLTLARLSGDVLSVNWTFPAEFVSGKRGVSVVLPNTGASWTNIAQTDTGASFTNNGATTVMQIGVRRVTGATAFAVDATVSDVRAMAIGRWF